MLVIPLLASIGSASILQPHQSTTNSAITRKDWLLPKQAFPSFAQPQPRIQTLNKLHSQKSQKMLIIPSFTNSLVPTMQVQASFYRLNAEAVPPSQARMVHLITATITFTSCLKTVYLDTIFAIKSIVVRGSSNMVMEIEWINETLANQALENWLDTSELILVVGDRFSRLNQDVSFYSVKSLARSIKMNTVTIQIRQTATENVITDWKLLVDHTSLPLDPTSAGIEIERVVRNLIGLNEYSHHLRKRDFSYEQLLFIQQLVEIAISVLESWAGSSTITKEWSLNYNPSESQATHKSTIDSSPKVQIECTNCYAHGKFSASVVAAGKFMFVESYAVKFTGEMAGNSNYTVKIPSKGFTNLMQVDFKLPLGTASVPGLFSVSPKYVLESRLVIESDLKMAAAFGWKYTIPLNMHISSVANTEPPNIDVQDTSVFNVLPVKFNEGTRARIAAYITSKIKIAIDVGGVNVDILVPVDDSIRLEVAQGDSRACPNVKLNYLVYRRSSVSLLLIDKIAGGPVFNTKIWERERQINCPFCNKCPKQPDTTSTDLIGIP